MKNILFYFEYIILTLIIGSCILIATIIDIVVKAFSAIVYLFIYTIRAIFELLFKKRYNCKFIKKLYILGGEWSSVDYYPLINFIFKHG
jgi:hypothetical protein